MPDKPKTCHFALRCPKCGHEWVEQIAVPMDVLAFCDRADAWGKRCPDCGNRPRRGSNNAIVMLLGKEHERVLKQKGVGDGA